MKPLSHLFINSCDLRPGTEWQDGSPGWRIVIVSKGAAYWLAGKEVCDLRTGDVLLAGPAVQGTLRASQISPVTLHFFHFQPEFLVGLLSLSERLSLDTFAQTAQTRIIPSSDAAAKEFAHLTQHAARGRSFFYRCRVLHLVAMIFGDAMPVGNQPATNVATTLLRFEEIISRIPDADLIHYSSEKLAEMCGCSLRHFRRMFHKQFKTSIRAKQTELRLEKARQMLVETDEKILTIARESGYRHLGFFNAIFKRKFGVTPTAWRQNQAVPTPPRGRSLHRREPSSAGGP